MVNLGLLKQGQPEEQLRFSSFLSNLIFPKIRMITMVEIKVKSVIGHCPTEKDFCLETNFKEFKGIPNRYYVVFVVCTCKNSPDTLTFFIISTTDSRIFPGDFR